MDEIDSESEYSETTTSATTTSFSSSEDNGNDTLELANVSKTLLKLPKLLCESKEAFHEFFSMETWNSLPDNFQAYLKNKYLPKFPENNPFEQQKTLEMLFNNQIQRFNISSLNNFQNNLEKGYYRPEICVLRKSIAKSKRKEQRFQECERISQLAKSLLLAREKLLRSAYDSPPGTTLNTERMIQTSGKMMNSTLAIKANKRAFQEISSIVSKLGLHDISDDEITNFDSGLFQKRQHIDEIISANEVRIVGTMIQNQKEEYITKTTINGTNEDSFRAMLIAHKKRKLEKPDRPEYDTNDIRLRDVLARTNVASGYKKSLPMGLMVGRKPTGKIKQENTKNNLQQQLPNNENVAINEKSNKLQQNLTSPCLQQFPTAQKSLGNDLSLENSNTESEGEVSGNMVGIKARHNSIVNMHGLNKRLKPPENIDIKEIKKNIVTNVNGNIYPKEQSQLSDVNINEQMHLESMGFHNYQGKMKAATYSDLEGIDMMHLHVDLDESGNIDLLNDIKSEPSDTSGPELMQETHVCFLSLIRDIFCSTPNHRMKLEELKSRIYSWLENPITALNDWYSQADNWLILIPSAINFLAGELYDQPEDFVPYIEFKPQMNIYQWIGAGRDSDQHLIHLCNYWLMRRHEAGKTQLQKFDHNHSKIEEFEDLILNDEPCSPPPPLCPTTWTVQPATPQEIAEFRIQEKKRFENPHKAFTYRMHGYGSVVGPVKGVYTQMMAFSKARGHNMLAADRPNFVTILTLVRDATARLPNGEGSRTDICELLKSSQYLNSQAQDSILQTIVSGALDRMHTEYDPCVRYDSKRKIWIYLHRNRTEEESERLHQQSQGIAKSKKATTRKIKQKSIKTTVPNTLVIDKSPVPTVMVATGKTVQTHSNKLSNKLNSPVNIRTFKVRQTTLPKYDSNTVNLNLNTQQESLINVELSPTTNPVIGTSNIQKPPSIMDSKKTNNTNRKLVTTSLIASSSISGAKPGSPCIQTIYTVKPVMSPGGLTDARRIGSMITQQQIDHSQSIGHNSPNLQNQMVVSNKRITKPLLINQTQTSTIVSPITSSGKSYIIPISISNNEQLKNIQSMPSTILASSNSKLLKSNQPILTTPVNTKLVNSREAAKTFVRVATSVSQLAKNVVNPHMVQTNMPLQNQQQSQQQQKILINTSSTNTQINQQQKSVVAQLNASPQMPKTTNAINLGNPVIIKANSSMSLNNVQQKQQN